MYLFGFMSIGLHMCVILSHKTKIVVLRAQSMIFKSYNIETDMYFDTERRHLN